MEMKSLLLEITIASGDCRVVPPRNDGVLLGLGCHSRSSFLMIEVLFWLILLLYVII